MSKNVIVDTYHGIIMNKYDLIKIIKDAYKNKLSLEDFCDMYYVAYDLEFDEEDASEKEIEIFDELSEVAGRFSPFEDEIKRYPKTYYSADELKGAICKALNKLNLE